MRNVKIDDNFTIRSYTFSYLDNIKIVDIGFVYNIESYTFYECFHLESVVIHYNEDISLRIIDSYAFYNSNYLDKVFFGGNESDWSKIQIEKNNDNLLNANRYYYSEDEPAEAGNYWHYVDGIPTIWD